MDPGTEVESAERREATRLTIGLPVELERGNGWTRDVSASGVYFETDESFTPGAPITLSLVLEYAYPTPLRLECQGQIIRVERRDGNIGVAAVITAYQLKPQDDPDPWHVGSADDDPPQGQQRPRDRLEPSSGTSR